MIARPSTDLLYAGEQWDADLGMQYLRARYYLPAQGIFNRLDPFFGNLDDPQSLHKYAYVHGDPVNGIDPSGLFTITEFMVNFVIIAMSIATVAGLFGGIDSLLGGGTFGAGYIRGYTWGLGIGALLAFGIPWVAGIVAFSVFTMAVFGTRDSLARGDIYQALFRATIGIFAARGFAGRPSRPMPPLQSAHSLIAMEPPPGFHSLAQYSAYSQRYVEGLHSLGRTDVTGLMIGSRITGRNSRTGAPRNANTARDFDLSIVSPSLFADAVALGVRTQSGGVRTRNLSPRSPYSESLGLRDMLIGLETIGGGKPTSVSIYRSMEEFLALPGRSDGAQFYP